VTKAVERVGAHRDPPRRGDLRADGSDGGPSCAARIARNVAIASRRSGSGEIKTLASWTERLDGKFQQVDFDRDEVLGIFNRRLRLLAMAHLAYLPDERGQPNTCAEFGVSVAAKARGRGYGKRLFELASLHARNRGVQNLLIHALSENVPMLRIARHAGAEVLREGSETQAMLRLPADTLASQVEQIVETGAAEWDYRFKQHAHRMERLLATLAALGGRSQPPVEAPGERRR